MDERLGRPKLGPAAAGGAAAGGGGVVVLGGGEASGPLYPPAVIDESLFSCESAARAAFSEAQLLPQDIVSTIGLQPATSAPRLLLDASSKRLQPAEAVRSKPRLPQDWHGLYDCFPICFVRAIEACGLAPPGGGGAWVEAMYEQTLSEQYPPAR